MKKREYVPYLIAIASGIFFLLIVFSIPHIIFLGVDLRIALLAGLGFLTFKILRWCQGLFSEMPV